MEGESKKLIVSLGIALIALLCIGVTFWIAGLAAAGLTLIISDYILFPLLFMFLGLGLYLLWKLPTGPNRNYRIGWYLCAVVILVVFIFVPQYSFLFWIALICLLCNMWNSCRCSWSLPKKK